MKLTFFSDTHSLHDQVQLNSGDILIHCGDFTAHGTLADTLSFAKFMARQKFTHKIVVAGNHDWCFEDADYLHAEACMREHGIIYLNDSGTRIAGVNFWGSPIQPSFHDWAFNRERGADIRRHWDLIPPDTDVLITHGPAFGILDWCTHGARVGCEDLLEAVQRIKPKVHACGHIHESYGVRETAATVFINACILDEHYEVRNAAISVEI